MGKQWKQWQTLFSWAPKSLRTVTAAMKLKDACSLEGKLWKTYTAYWKAEPITWPTKVHIVKAVAFLVVLYGCKKKAECWRIDVFELWCWRGLLRFPWTARRSNQSILKEIYPEYSLEGLMLKLKLQSLATWCKELTHWKRPWCWKRLRAGGKGDDRGWDCWIASLIQWTLVWANSGRWWRTGKPGVMQSVGLQRVEHGWAE